MNALGILLQLAQQHVLIDVLYSLDKLVIVIVLPRVQYRLVQTHDQLLAYLKVVPFRLELLEQLIKKLVHVQINVRIGRIMGPEGAKVFRRRHSIGASRRTNCVLISMRKYIKISQSN